MPFLGFTQEKYSHILSDKHEIQSYQWWKDNYNSPGYAKYGIEQVFIITNNLHKLEVVTEFQNKEGEAIGYWLIDTTDNTTHFRTAEQVTTAIQTGKLRLI